MTKRLLSNAFLALWGLAAASHALALGFGRIPDSVVFGQALDLSVPLRLEPGESLSPACLQAEVSIGEQRLPAAAVSVVLERSSDGTEGTRLRIRSNVVVHEPLVSINLAAGCSGSVSRQFVVFADPPGTSAPLALTQAPPAAPMPTPNLMAPSAAPATAAPVPAPTDSMPPAGVAEPPPVRAEAKAARVTDAPATKANRVKPSAQTARADAPRKRAQSRAAAAPQTTRSAQRAVPRPAERATPRLTLEEPDDRLQAAIQAVAAQEAAASSAVMAASAAQAAASASEQRMAALEKSLLDMRAEAAAHRANLEQMRQRVAQSEEQSRWMWALALVVLLLAGFALWLGLRVRALQREREAGWWVAAQAHGAAEGSEAPMAAVAGSAPTSAAVDAAAPSAAADPLVPSQPSPAMATAPATLVTAADAMADAADVPQEASNLYRSGAVLGAATAQEALTRAVSVDELIDLEQQAEFFVVLGEEDAAIDLLMSHLRSTGGVSPLPYLKLLEIYRRRQDPESYERMRKRFNHRFNAVAPDWQSDPDAGRDLQDYPAVLAAVQDAWHVPLDAMAELENLLFRKRSNELFELPAYRDVLALFAVARDLHRLGDEPAEDVDVLLPLLNHHDQGSTVPLSIFDRLDRSDDVAGAVVEDRPTAPIDLDLSEMSAVGAELQRSH